MTNDIDKPCTFDNRPYQYRHCGLNNVYLLNGYTIRQTRHGETVSIHDIDGLHRAIAKFLIRERKTLSGPEARFLRHELGYSQKVLAGLLGKNIQTIARWEKGESRIDGPADRLLRLMYKLRMGSHRGIGKLLRKLADIDNQPEEPLQFRRVTEKGWRLHIAA